MSKHTPEPWKVGDDFHVVPHLTGARHIYWVSPLGTRYHLADVVYPPQVGKTAGSTERHANAERIVACVNACAGMSDPAAELAALRKERDKLREALEAIELGCSFPEDNVQRAIRDRARTALANTGEKP